MVDNAMIRDKRLSWKAKGILTYLLGRQEGWRVQVSDIMERATDGETAVRGGLQGLRTFGYAKLEEIRLKGRIVDRRFTISENGDLVDRVLASPHRDFPNVEKPHVEKPNGENHQLNKTEDSNTGPKQNKKRKAFEPSVDFLNDKLQEEWAAFQISRQQMRKPMTEIARGRMVRKISAMPVEDAIAQLRQSTDKGWADIYPVNQDKGAAKPKLRVNKRNEIINKLNRRKAELMRKPQTKEVQRELAAIQTQLYKL